MPSSRLICSKTTTYRIIAAKIWQVCTAWAPNKLIFI